MVIRHPLESGQNNMRLATNEMVTLLLFCLNVVFTFNGRQTNVKKALPWGHLYLEWFPRLCCRGLRKRCCPSAHRSSGQDASMTLSLWLKGAKLTLSGTNWIHNYQTFNSQGNKKRIGTFDFGYFRRGPRTTHSVYRMSTTTDRMHAPDRNHPIGHNISNIYKLWGRNEAHFT